MFHGKKKKLEYQKYNCSSKGVKCITKKNTTGFIYILHTHWFLSLENSVFEYQVECCRFTPSVSEWEYR